MPGKTEGRGDFCTCNHPRAVHESRKDGSPGACFLCNCGSYVERSVKSSAGLKRPVKSRKKKSAQ